MAVQVFPAKWFEDGSATCYGRMMARDGTGGAIVGEGRYLKQADLSSITYAIFDAADPDTAIATGTVTIATSVFDTPQTTLDDAVWRGNRGFNFRHDLSQASFPVGGKTYRVQYTFTTTGGTKGYIVFEGPAEAVGTS